MQSLLRKYENYYFFYHYYKAMSIKQGCTCLTLHWEDTCHVVHKVVTHVQTETHENLKRQPRCTIRGWAKDVQFTEKNGKIVAIVK